MTPSAASPVSTVRMLRSPDDPITSAVVSASSTTIEAALPENVRAPAPPDAVMSPVNVIGSALDAHRAVYVRATCTHPLDALTYSMSTPAHGAFVEAVSSTV